MERSVGIQVSVSTSLTEAELAAQVEVARAAFIRALLQPLGGSASSIALKGGDSEQGTQLVVPGSA